MDIDTLQGLKKSPLFKDFDESEIIDLMHTIRYRVIHYRKGDIWKSRACLTPEGKATLTPENLLFLTPVKS